MANAVAIFVVVVSIANILFLHKETSLIIIVMLIFFMPLNIQRPNSLQKLMDQ